MNQINPHEEVLCGFLGRPRISYEDMGDAAPEMTRSPTLREVREVFRIALRRPYNRHVPPLSEIDGFDALDSC